MKARISITVDEDVLSQIREHMRSNPGKNKSRLVEEAILRYLAGGGQ